MLFQRKHRISRLEEFSDPVFGFALTLLVITSAVPRNFDQLMLLLQGIPAFACCFALFVWIWHEHDAFFERNPLQDGTTTVLNSALLLPYCSTYPCHPCNPCNACESSESVKSVSSVRSV